MILNSEIKIPERLKGKTISIDFHEIRIPHIVKKIRIYPLTSIRDEDYKGTGIVFYDKNGNCRGADRVDICINTFCKVAEKYFKD